MGSFDIIETSGKAYIKAWEERRYLMRLSLIPLGIKILLYACVLQFDLQQNILRQTLVMLPAYLLEGWLLAHVVRLIWFGQRWPITLTGNPEHDAANVAEKGRGILAGMIIYTLLRMAQNGLIAPFEPVLGSEAAKGPPDPSLLVFALGVFLAFVMVWAFRFLWIYIPMTINLPLSQFVRFFPGFTSSVYFIGAWLVCYIPFILCTALIFNIALPLFSGMQSAGLLIAVLGYLVFDTAAMIVVTICFSIALYEAIHGRPSKGKSSQ